MPDEEADLQFLSQWEDLPQVPSACKRRRLDRKPKQSGNISGQKVWEHAQRWPRLLVNAKLLDKNSMVRGTLGKTCANAKASHTNGFWNHLAGDEQYCLWHHIMACSGLWDIRRYFHSQCEKSLTSYLVYHLQIDSFRCAIGSAEGFYRGD